MRQGGDKQEEDKTAAALACFLILLASGSFGRHLYRHVGCLKCQFLSVLPVLRLVIYATSWCIEPKTRSQHETLSFCSFCCFCCCCCCAAVANSDCCRRSLCRTLGMDLVHSPLLRSIDLVTYACLRAWV